jgi:hypothetical protein
MRALLCPWLFALLSSAFDYSEWEMISEAKPSRVVYENLDTSFVNLWGLLRYLSQRSFVGRVHVELQNYTADVFLTGTNTPLVHEVDAESGSDVVEEAALHRLVLRVRESPGSISVYEGSDEAIAAAPATIASTTADDETEVLTVASSSAPLPPDQPSQPANEAEWNEIVRAGGELIAGIERAATSAGADFASLFRESRIGLADEYAFLDPASDRLQYENSLVTLNGELPANRYVLGLTEALRRVVDQIATGDRARRIRERVALELACATRKNDEAMTRSGFKAQLDRIAGTRVI